MSVSSHNSAYRRGVVLGLTMAEIIILIIFLLLLAFASLLKKEQEKTAGITNLTPAARASLEKVTHFINSQPPEIGEKLVRGIEAMPEVLRKIEEDELAASAEEQPQQVIMRGLEKLEMAKRAAEASNTGEDFVPVEQQLAQEKEKVGALTEKVAMLEGKVREGFGPPPCWDPGNRRYTEYIYRAELTSEGIVLTDIAAPRWGGSKQSLPLQGVTLGVPLSTGDFIRQITPLSSWSRQKDCRFLVNVADKTKAEEKERFQEMYEAIYNHFQIDGVGRKRSTVTKTKEVSQAANINKEKAPKDKKSLFESLFSSDGNKSINQKYN